MLKQGKKSKYQKERNTFLLTVKETPERRIDVEIGDSKSDDFKPQVKTKWFNNKYNRSIRATEPPEATVKEDGDKIIYETPEYSVIQYDKPDAGEEGGHELEWELPRKPKSNELHFTLRYKGDVRFYYQRELTKKEKEQGAERPDNVVGSYSVYIDKANHKIGDNNYGTGKIEHIYRPKAIDAEGNEAWCDLYIPEEGEAETNINCKVVVPQEFLDKAVYPVLVDPTFGYTSVGGTKKSILEEQFSRIYRFGNIYTFSNSESQLDSLDVYIYGTPSFSGNADPSITADVDALLNERDSDGSGQHGQLSRNTTNIDGTEEWKTFSFSPKPTLNNGTEYVINVTGDDSTINTSEAYIFSYYDELGDGTIFASDSSTQTTYPPEDPWTPQTERSTEGRNYSIYATYTASTSAASLSGITKITGATKLNL